MILWIFSCHNWMFSLFSWITNEGKLSYLVNNVRIKSKIGVNIRSVVKWSDATRNSTLKKCEPANALLVIYRISKNAPVLQYALKRKSKHLHSTVWFQVSEDSSLITRQGFPNMKLCGRTSFSYFAISRSMRSVNTLNIIKDEVL